MHLLQDGDPLVHTRILRKGSAKTCPPRLLVCDVDEVAVIADSALP